MTIFKLKIRKMNKKYLGATIPVNIINEYDLNDGDEIFVKLDSVVKGTVEYKCGVCNCEWYEDVDEIEVICPACGAEHVIVKEDDDMKGGME